MKDNMAKIYAAFRSGCLGNNILEAYFPFFANIICEENWDVIDELQVADKFKTKYNIPIPLTFVRQVLSIGMQKDAITYNRGKYVANKSLLSTFKFESNSFDIKWESMQNGFIKYCEKNEFDIAGYDIETRILSFIEKHEDILTLNETLNAPDNSDTFDYLWSKYLTEIEISSPSDFNFVASLSFSNILKQAVFFSGDGQKTFSGLNVYLDSPMIFALLGMDSSARMNSCKYLLDKMQSSGIKVQVFDHNFQEVEGILARAAGWAVSPDYDMRKANNAVRFFHDNQMNEQDIAEFCNSIENKLIQMNITIKKTKYDIYHDIFQEDEKQLYRMIESKYLEQSQVINEEKKNSILIDVRSIIMVYRERKGQTSTRIQSSCDILLTLNSTIANVSKDYESNKSLNSGHIPACVSADLFGTVLWLFSPADLLEYHRKQLLADCYLSLKPTKKLINRYIESLESARAADEIDEKKFLFLRSHAVVNDALMNVTKGDYARFNDRSYLEVYEEIQAVAEKKYLDETESHIITKMELQQLNNEKEEYERQIQKLKDDNKSLIDQKEEQDIMDFNTKHQRWGWILTLLLFGIPYIVLLGIIEIEKSKYSNFNSYSVVRLSGLIILSLFLALVFKHGKKKCFELVETYLRKPNKNIDNA